MEDPFESPKLLVEEARYDLQTVVEKQSEFFARRPLAPFERSDRQSGRIVYGLRPTAAIPGRIRAKANATISQLRHALDQAVFAATQQLSGRPTGNRTYFPFCQSPADFDVVMAKRSRDVAPSLHGYLRALEPYPTSASHPGGNDLFRALGTVAGPAKHEVSLALAMDTNLTVVSNFTVLAGEAEVRPRWVSDINEFHIAIGEPNSAVRFDVTPHLFIRFDHVGPIGQAPASKVLRDLCSMVDRVVLGIEAETARLLRSDDD